MQSFSTHEFRANIKKIADLAIGNHEPVRVTRRTSGNFVVMGEEDFLAEQETLYVLQNQQLMTQIAESLQSATDQKQLTKGQIRAEFDL